MGKTERYGGKNKKTTTKVDVPKIINPSKLFSFAGKAHIQNKIIITAIGIKSLREEVAKAAITNPQNRESAATNNSVAIFRRNRLLKSGSSE
ncbi:hypothetical protein GCM10017044_20240 [Kordiimonas sediminis]|uniref:Uncharacterized protein n=1 Tax=Kordiimonas sediminis TaxID=1735581 RepID=A0A919E975_9PROT|nr:hypothetical protein GCM10017044_20240 [Kordiimonas sediminis]